MKAIFIDSVNKTAEFIDFEGDFRAIQEKLDVDCFTCVSLQNEDTLYVDDEGLINGTEHFFYVPSFYPQPLAGNCLILGTDEMGESTDVKMDRIPDIKFLDMLDVQLMAMAH